MFLTVTGGVGGVWCCYGRGAGQVVGGAIEASQGGGGGWEGGGQLDLSLATSVLLWRL